MILDIASGYATIAGKEMGSHANAAYESCLRFVHTVPETYKLTVLMATAFHDIGKVNKSDRRHHALVGYDMLNLRVSELCRYLVLTHTDSMLFVDSEELAMARFRLNKSIDSTAKLHLSKMMACVTLADLTAGHLGGVVRFKDRLASIAERHGSEAADRLPKLFYSACATLNLDPNDYE